MKRVALMQPYFFPYPRYFRLFAEVDEFVIHDDVQFTKSGRIHRTEVPGTDGVTQWLTLPLQKLPHDTLIRDLGFSGDARMLLDRRLRRLPWLWSARGPAADTIREFLQAPLLSPIDYLEDGLRLVVGLFGIGVRITRCSEYALDPALRGQERVIAAVKAAGGTHYVNLPGGKALYDPSAFEDAGIDLRFLPEYLGPHKGLLPALVRLPPSEIVL